MLFVLYHNIFQVYSFPGVLLPDLAFDMPVSSGREREGDNSVCTEPEASSGLSCSGSTFMRNQRPKEGSKLVLKLDFGF